MKYDYNMGRRNGNASYSRKRVERPDGVTMPAVAASCGARMGYEDCYVRA